MKEKKPLIISRLSGNVSERWSAFILFFSLRFTVFFMSWKYGMQLGIFVLKEKKFMSDPDSRLQSWVAVADID